MAARTKVDLYDEAGVVQCCEHFGVTIEQLTEAVFAVGAIPARCVNTF